MEYAVLDVTSDKEMPELSNDVKNTVVSLVWSGGKVYSATDEEAGLVRGLLGVFPSHIPGVIEICMMHTFGPGSDDVISKAFVEYAMTDNEAKVVRCQLIDDASRGLVAGLDFTHESCIYAIDLGEPKDMASEGIISITGKGFAYLDITQRNQLRHLIRLAAEDESAYTGETYEMPDSTIDGIFLDISESKYDVYVKLKDDAVVGMLMIDPVNPQYSTIGSVAVHPDHRLNGFGRDLVTQAVADYGGDERLVLATILEKTPHLKEFFTNCGLSQMATIHKYALAE